MPKLNNNFLKGKMNLDLDDKILLWQSCAGPYPQKWTHRSRAESMREDTCHLTVPGRSVRANHCMHLSI